MTPRDLALALLRQRFAHDAPADDVALAGLAAFQRDAVHRLLRALEQYRGALLADSVGLGKTHVGAAVVRHFVAHGCAAGVIVPSSLLRQWRRALRGVDRVTFATHATLSRGGVPALARAALLVVDEAHAFRNPATRRYAALARVAAGSRVLLITATPVNNSLRDLYWLLRLFADDATFAPAGVPDLVSCVRAAERTGRSAGIHAVLGEIAVRRTRDLLGDDRADDDGAAGIVLRFPRRTEPREVRYAVDAELQRELLDCVESLRLAPWTQFGALATSLLLRLVLLKRLESSRAAFRASLARLLAMLVDFRAALAAGRLLTPMEQRLRHACGTEQLALDELLLRALPKHVDVAALDADAAHDIAALEHAVTALAHSGDDPKIDALRALLASLGERPAIVFTEYRETAHHLWLALAPQHRVALIHGSAAYLGRSPAARRTVVERFAPLANGLPPPPAREAVRVLIATDVLAEGLNLQDAADVVSYDLPWNPVRLLQRIGRVDRLGSHHDEVRAWYFRPDRQLDALLALLQRLRTKLRAIRGSIGEEAAVLSGGGRTDGGRPRTRRLAAEAFMLEERLRQACLRQSNSRDDGLAGTPLGASADRRPHPRRDVEEAAIVPIVRPALEALRGVDAVLFFECGGRQRAICAAAGRFREDPRAAAALLLRILEAPDATADGAPELTGDVHADRRLVAAARRWLARPPSPRRQSARIRALRARLYRLLQERAGGPTVAECQRVERLAARLAGPLSLTEELAVRAEASRRTRDLDALLERLEAALPATPARPAAPDPLRQAVPAPVADPRFMGGFRLRGG